MGTDDKTAELDDFRRAMSLVPQPVSCFANGVVCPWCGMFHKSVTFGANGCQNCEREFFFGYPDWHEGKDPITFVPFPWKEWEAFGRSSKLMEQWTPNKRLQEIYFQKSEETLGVWADPSRPN